MMPRNQSLTLAVILPLFALIAASCDSAALKANQETVQQNQQEIERMQHEIEDLKSQQTGRTPQPPPGSCDRDVFARATRQGGEKYASGDFSKALGYYQDALAACPGNARAELNVGRAYEAMSDRQQALNYYQQAASSGDPDEKGAEAEAHTAVDRLGGVPP